MAVAKAASTDALPQVKADRLPLLILPVIALLALPAIMDLPAWLTLTVAGLAMGMMIFLMASGLTLVFGLMDVLNFGHGAFISVGAFVGASVMLPLIAWMQADSFALNMAALLPGILAAMLVAGLLSQLHAFVVIRLQADQVVSGLALIKSPAATAMLALVRDCLMAVAR